MDGAAAPNRDPDLSAFAGPGDRPPARGRLLFVDLWPRSGDEAAGPDPDTPAGAAFWRHLSAATITPPGTSIDGGLEALIESGHGLTHLARRQPTRDERDREAIAGGVGLLWQRVAVWRPAAVVFIERAAAEAAAGRPLTERWGSLVGVALAGRPCFLMAPPDAPEDEAAAALTFLRNLRAALPRPV